MTTPLFPAFLQLNNRPCLLVGGEKDESVEKGQILLQAGATLTVVSPRLAPKLQQLFKEGRLIWLQETIQSHHLDGVWFVLSTSDNEEENQFLYSETNRRTIFLNVVDKPDFCSCQWPAIIHQPPVMVAFSTLGTSPALAAYLRRQIQSLIPENIGIFANWLSVWRKKVSPKLPNLETKGRFWRALFDQGIAERFLSGDKSGAETMVHQALKNHTPTHHE